MFNRFAPDNGSVTDQLFLSIWLDAGGRADRLRRFEKLLRLFPFSQREQPQSVVSILAIDLTEPPLLERPLNGPFEIAEVLPIFNEYSGADLAFEIESWWDLWVFEAEWKLRPSRVLLSCFGPEFDNGTDRQSGDQEDLRIDFGVDTHYLPMPEIPGSAKLTESNVKSLLRLVHELDSALAIKKRQLQTESGGNFAERLESALRSSTHVQ